MFIPRYEITPVLLERIKAITLLVHELNQQTISDVVLAQLADEARAVSAYASTSIEGNPLPLTEVRRLLKRRPDQLRRSEQEVVNYNEMLRALVRQEGDPFTLALLLQIHRGVMTDLLPVHQVGQLRREPVVVYDPRSGDVVYLPPDHQDVPRLVDELVAFVQANRQVLDPLLLAGLVHKQLVVIHPFVDGNGRTTRLVTKFLLAGLGLNLFHLFSFETFYNRNVTRYFEHVGVFGDYQDLVDQLDFTPWLMYFAAGILDELLRVRKEIEKNLATPATRLQPYHQRILDHIDAHGFITDRDYAQLTERAKATRALDFRFLLDLGVIVREGRGRGTYYRRAGAMTN
ncbi:MAG: Fic family protein [Anaerolineales bacterium]|nr:Fic family protein [Anaerolineales bacterium]